MRGAIAHTCLCTCLKHGGHAKKSTPCLIKKVSRCAADHTSKNNNVPYLSLSVNYKDLTRKSCVFICYFIDSGVKNVLSKADTGGVPYKKVFLKFVKFTGKHLCQSLLFNKFAGAADVFTYRLNLKIFEHSL